MFEIETSIDY